MNRITVILTVISLSCLFCQCTKNADSGDNKLITKEGDCFPDVADKYIYPIYDFEECINMGSEEELNACQIPDSVLKSISTLGLICSFIDAPNPTPGASFVLRTTFFQMFWHLNCVQEMLTRKDVSKSLITYYAAIKLDCYKQYIDCRTSWENCIDIYGNIDDCKQILYDCEKQSLFQRRYCALEYLFTAPEILNQLDNKYKKSEVVKLLLAKYEEWQNQMKLTRYSILSAMVWIMYDDMLPYFEKKSYEFPFTGGLAAAFYYVKEGARVDELTDDIIAFAKYYTR